MALVAFLAQVVVISLSGVMAPGPVTAATIELGTRNRHAGALLALGHGIVEFPLIVVITLGMAVFFESVITQIVIGLAGGLFLWLMGLGMIKTAADTAQQTGYGRRGPLLTGIVLSGGNPYFLLWWATAGLALALQAKSLGAWAFVLFAAVHWSMDLIWLWILSWFSYKGARILGPKTMKWVVILCGSALILFGLNFLCDAAVKLARL